MGELRMQQREYSTDSILSPGEEMNEEWTEALTTMMKLEAFRLSLTTLPEVLELCDELMETAGIHICEGPTNLRDSLEVSLSSSRM
jgi:hypothetical protein